MPNNIIVNKGETIDYNLSLKADKRIKNSTQIDFLKEDEVLLDIGVTREKLNSMEEVEFE